MYILLVAATTNEIQPTIDWLEGSGFLVGDHEIKVLLSGVGSLSTAYLLTHNIKNSRPDIILQAGIAGCFTDKKKGAVLAIKTEILADIGVWEESRFKTVFDLQLADPDEAPFTRGRLVNPHEKLFALAGLEEAGSLTVNEITTNPERIAWYTHNWSPVVENMEGGALHYVCLREGIPFLQIRSISNEIGDRDKGNWDIGTAVANLNTRVMALLNVLESIDEIIN